MTDRGRLDLMADMYELWNAGELDGAASLMDEEIEYVNPDYAVEPGVRKGRAAVREAMEASLVAAFGSYRHELHELIEATDDRVLVLLTFRARGRDSGAQIEVAEQHVWTFREGRVVRIEWFHDEAAARAAAGIA